MSEYIWIACERCGVNLCLGKLSKAENGQNFLYTQSKPVVLATEDTEVNRALWKFLANHFNHNITIVSDYSSHFEVVASYTEIGGDEIGDISFESYLKDWDG